MANISGNSLNNTINGTIFADTLLGLGGNDTLNGMAGNDRLDGGTGIDLIRFAGLFGSFTFTYVGAVGAGNNASTFRSTSGANGVDTILNAERIVFADNIVYNLKLGNNTPNTLIGTATSDLLLGFNGNDTLNGGAGNDLLNGDANDDTLNGGAGNDRLNGGAGIDTLRFAASIDTFTFANTGVFTSRSAADGTDTILSAERAIFGASPAYTLKLGTNANNPLAGTAGNDLMLGFNGNDVLNGLAGNDYLNGGLGNDRLDGGAGTDTARFAGLFDTFAFAFINPTTFMTSSAADGADTVLNMERITFGNNISYALKLGTNAVNTLTGTAGNDLLLGFNGNDTLNAGVGNDLIDGGANNDKVDGGAGNDRILHNITKNIGAVDTVIGGLGIDTLVLQATHAQYNSLITQGVITAFNASNHAVPFNFAGRGLPFAMNLTVTGVEALQIIAPLNAAPTAVTFKPISVNEYQAIDGFNGNGNVAKEFTLLKANILNTVTDADDASGHTLTITGVPAGLLLISQTATTVTFKVTDPVAINALNTGATKDFIVTASVTDIQGKALTGQNFTLKINGESLINGTANDDSVNLDGLGGFGVVQVPALYGGFNTNPNGTTIALMGNETINGLDGDDRLYGDLKTNNGTLNQAGNDILNGGNGSDILYGDARENNGTIIQAGNDTQDGGDGSEVLIGDVLINSSGATIQTAGADTLNGGAGIDTLHGDARDNNGTLTTAGNDTLNGGDGVDDIFGDVELNGSTATIQTAGADTLNGGDGNDTIVGDAWINNNIITTAGADILIGGLGDDDLAGDILYGDKAGTGGNDELDGGDGTDTAYYISTLAEATFTYVGGTALGLGGIQHNPKTFQITAPGEGTDTLTNVDQIVFDTSNYDPGTMSPYTLILGTNNGGDNNRTPLTVLGNILLLSGTVGENDLILGFNGNDLLVGDEPLVATFIANTSDDALVGGAGDDALVGDVLVVVSGGVTQAGNDILLGGLGNDNFHGDVANGVQATTGGNDEIDGGANTDTAYYIGLLANFTFTYVGDVGTGPGGVDHDATTFQMTGVGEGTDTLTRVEQVKFDNNNNTSGNPVYNLVLGTSGIDTLNGQIGSDLILGFGGSNFLNGDGFTNASGTTINQTGQDGLVNGDNYGELYGDYHYNNGTINTAGNDILKMGNGGGFLIGDLGDNNGTLGQSGKDSLYGGAGADILVGDVYLNVTGKIITTAGNDYLDGGAGNDFLYGDVATNNGTLTNEGSDILFGREGNDFLQGGTTNLTGFARDYYVYDFSILNGNDTIWDYYPVLDNDTLVFLNVADANNSGGAPDINDLLALTSVTDVGGFAQLNLFSSATTQDNTTLIGTVQLQQFGGGIAFDTGPVGNEITGYIDQLTDIAFTMPTI